jgi:flagellar biosynthetic protein FliR
MGTPILNSEQILAFTFVFLRIGAMLVMIPVVGESTVPLRVKAGLALLISLIAYPSVRMAVPTLQPQAEIIAVAAAMIGEVMIGLLLGFAAKIVFAGIQFAGDMIGVQMGFSIVNVIDPVSRVQTSIMAEFQYLIAALVYLAIDAHHLFIYAIVDSYRLVAPFGYHFSGALLEALISFSSGLFSTAIKISAPVMAVLLFTNVALGIVARTVPQINVFIVGFPLQIAAGLFFVGLTVPIFIKLVQRAMTGLNTELYTLLRLM